MKRNIFTIMTLCIVAVLFAVGCAKQPVEDMNATKASVDALMAQKADQYAPEDTKKINDTLAEAMNEIKAQEGKMMKNYAKAKELLAEAKSEAENLKVSLPMKKEEAKNNAMSSMDTASAAITEAKSLLAKAPKGKGSRADIEAMKADLKGLEESLAEVQNSIDTEDYAEAMEKAASVRDKANEVSAQITQAMEKVSQTK